MNGFKLFAAAVCTVATGFLGGWDKILYALVVFIVIDYLTGVMAAFSGKTLSSYKGLNGIIKKVVLLVLVGVAATLDSILGMADPWLRTAVIYFLLANEGVSILENISRLGVPIPGFLKSALEQLADKGKGAVK